MCSFLARLMSHPQLRSCKNSPVNLARDKSPFHSSTRQVINGAWEGVLESLNDLLKMLVYTIRII